MRRIGRVQWSLIGVGLVLCSSALASTLPDQECVPIAAPVTTCGCPVGVGNRDYCKGELPKAGACMYGDVMCMTSPGKNCVQPAGGGANSCGIVIEFTDTRAPACGSGSFDFCDPNDPNGGMYANRPHRTKPPCTTTWGSCEYTEPTP